MRKSLAEIAKIVGGQLVGDGTVEISGFSGIKEAKEGDLTFLANPKYLPLVETTKASAILTPRDMTIPGKSFIRCDNPSLAFAKIIGMAVGTQTVTLHGIHPSAVIAKDAVLGKDVAVGPHAIIASGAHVGDRTTVHGGTYIGPGAVLGADCYLYPLVTIRERVTIGNRVIVHSGTVIGSDGFGYVNVDGAHVKIPQIGTVVVEDDVEIGANVTIDRARFDKTLIGRGTKIDNLVQIAHNVIIGEHCIIVAQVGLSGSTVVGKGAILAGQAGVAGHLTIGEGAIVAAQAGVTKSVPPHTQVSGYPAKPHDKALAVNAHLQRLPHYVEQIQELKRRIEELEKKITKS